LAVAFYKNGQLLKSYSTLDIIEASERDDTGQPPRESVSVSASHYSVFQSEPEMVKIVQQDGPIFSESWIITATTVGERELVFSVTS
jgi:hypothetical protein